MAATFGTTTASNAPLWIAADKGLFNKYGLSVNLQYAESSTGTASLIAGEVQFGVGDAATVFAADTSGAALKIVASLNQSNSYSIVVRPDIKTPADLKGKTLAIAKQGDTSDISAHIALKPYGLQVGTDVPTLSVGNSAPRLAALLSGQVAAAVLSEAFVDQAVKQGMHILVNLEQAKIPYLATGIQIADSFGKANPNTVIAYLKGVIDGERFFADEANKSEVYAILARYFKTKPDDPAVASNYAFYHTRLVHDPYPTKDGADTVLDALKAIDPQRYANVTSDSILDPSFMSAIRSSGFLKATWGEQPGS